MFKVYELLPVETLRALGFRLPKVRVRPKRRRKRRDSGNATIRKAVAW